jgi:hypothetical protein
MAKKRKSTRKKTASKKTSKPDTVEITIKREVFGHAPEEHHFVVSDGRVLKNLKELADALHDMSDEIFRQHVNEFKNDFQNWVNDIFHEEELAEELAHVKSQLEAEVAVLRHLVKKINR